MPMAGESSWARVQTGTTATNTILNAALDMQVEPWKKKRDTGLET